MKLIIALDYLFKLMTYTQFVLYVIQLRHLLDFHMFSMPEFRVKLKLQRTHDYIMYVCMC